MKLSEMTTDQTADVLVQIAPDIEILMSDGELIDKIQNRAKSNDKSEATKLGMAVALNVATHLLKNHRESTWNIVGALNSKSAADVAAQSFPATLSQIVEIISDKDLMDFFTPSGQSAPETQSVSLPV